MSIDKNKKVKIYPSKASGSILIPSSKSVLHRALICAVLAQGESNVYYQSSLSQDILATIEGLRNFDCDIKILEDKILINSKGFKTEEKNVSFSVTESGSSLRMLVPICALAFNKTKISGTQKLFERPLKIYQNIFEDQDLHFYKTSTSIEFLGKLKAGAYEIVGNVSSQFISGLMFALPLLEEDSSIVIKGSFESRSYVDLTVSTLADFGIKVEELESNTYFIKGGQTYKNNDFTVEGDYSQMAFFGVLAAINDALEIGNLKHDSKQGDKAIVKVLEEVGAIVRKTDQGFSVQKNKLKSFEIDLKDCPDLGPILFVLASCVSGTSVIHSIERLKLKESDRIEAMVINLEKLGVSIVIKDEAAYITSKPFADKEYEFEAYNDHRIFMALSVLSTILPRGAIIDDADSINKSYPDFLADLRKLKINCKVIGE